MAEVLVTENGEQKQEFIGLKLAPFNPINISALTIVFEMLQIEKLSEGSILYDLGCGDGRVLVEACKTNDLLRAIGVEYDLSLYIRATENIRKNCFDSRASIIHDNVLNVSFKDASAIFVYLVPEGIKAISEVLLEALGKNVLIVTYVFSIPKIKPVKTILYKESTKLYLYSRESLMLS
jgi:precorrin-6B methylase 2